MSIFLKFQTYFDVKPIYTVLPKYKYTKDFLYEKLTFI